MRVNPLGDAGALRHRAHQLPQVLLLQSVAVPNSHEHKVVQSAAALGKVVGQKRKARTCDHAASWCLGYATPGHPVEVAIPQAAKLFVAQPGVRQEREERPLTQRVGRAMNLAISASESVPCTSL